MDSAKTRALKNKKWRENNILPKKILQELQYWQGVITENNDVTLEVRIPEAVMISGAFPKVQHGEWNKEQKHWTSYKKEMEAIFLGLFRYGQAFKELQIKAILIKSDSSTTIQDLAKQIADQSLVTEVKKIVKLCQQLRIQTEIQHIQGVSNKITDTLSRLSTQGEYSIKKKIFTALCQAWQIILTLDLFATGENQLVDRFMFGKALIAWEMFKPKSILIAPWWPSQIWFTHLLTVSSRYLLLGESSLILNLRKEMTKRKDMLPPGKIAAFVMDQESNKEENYQQNSQITQT
ncbi:MAG: hypothetical protein EZS28_004295 [Streblomastix strix]|uniref:Uncharacterized protein n=1 Tax=Streblomastix strix TaxID=222440 RepID=A0A5J4WYJ2_9EUKA|nr:MAG: hypothetical protein EZS28_004295 [Streblomastix strix]